MRLSLLFPLLLACDAGDTAKSDETGVSDTGDSAATDTDATDSAATDTDGTFVSDCADATTNPEAVACATQAFLDTLSADQLAQVAYDFEDGEARTLWSNLPTTMVERAGLAIGDMSASSQSAVDALAATLLSADGYADFVGVRAADEYLSTIGGSGGGLGASDYSADFYYVAVFGTPSATGTWALMIGGHHMAYNVTWVNGIAYPTPNHLGSEPKAPFTLDGETYAPVEAEGAAFSAAFAALDTEQLSDAFLGTVMSDVLLGPDEYGKGTLSAVDYPSGSERGGILVSELTAAQQALVLAAMQQWVADFDPEIADDLMAEYSTPEALDDTLLAWTGTESAGPDVDVNGTYFRIDGPRVWIEVACQGGIIIQGETHYHTIYRDKSGDYGGTL